MPITDRQRERRRHHLGSSDMAAVLGLDKYRTPYDVWLEKTGKLDADDDANEAMALGTALEDGVLDWASGQLGPIRRNQYRSHPTLPIASHIDGLVVSTGSPVEAKTTGLLGPVSDVWGEEGSDHVPERVIVQVHCHVLALQPAAVERAHVPALIGGRGLLMFHLTPSPAILDAVGGAADRFWTRHVRTDIPPEGAPSLAVAKLIRRTPGKVVTLEPYEVAVWLDAKEQLARVQAAEERAKAELLAALGDAEAGEVIGPDGLGAVTHFEQRRGAYTVPETRYRVLRYRKKGLPTS